MGAILLACALLAGGAEWRRSHVDGVTVWVPSVVVDGQLAVVELLVPSACDPVGIVWKGKAYPAYPSGTHLQVLLPVDLDTPEGNSDLMVRCAEKELKFSLTISRGVYPESTLEVNPKFSKAPPQRAVDEQVAIDLAFSKSAVGRLWQEPFVWPGPGERTSPFGVRRTFNGELKSRHRGSDLDARVGDAVHASNDGVVVLAAPDFYFVGSAVFIDHGDELFTMYFHLSRLDVKVGEKVARGQVIGAAGASGRVTGPHVHFATKLAGVYVNPEDVMRYAPGMQLVVEE